MSYTHYYSFEQVKPIKGKHTGIEIKYQLAIRQCQRLIKRHNLALKKIDLKHEARLSGYSAHTKSGDYLGVAVNGTGELSHEDFFLCDHWSNNAEFNFCKTAMKPYDIVVVACLITLKHYLGDIVVIESDGRKGDWLDGLKLVHDTIGLTTAVIPESIEGTALKSA